MVLRREVNDVTLMVDVMNLPSCPRILSMTVIVVDVVQYIKSFIPLRSCGWIDYDCLFFDV